MDPTGNDTQTNQVVQAQSLEEFSNASAGDLGNSSFEGTSNQENIDDVQKKHRRRANFFRLFLIFSLLGLFALSAGGIFWLTKIRKANPPVVNNVNEKYEITNLPADQLSGKGQLSLDGKLSEVAINGSMQVGGTLRLVPTSRPSNPVVGQQYVDSSDNKLYLFNGSQWIAQLNVVDLNAVNATIQNLTVQNASIANQVNANSQAIGNTSIPSNTTLQGNTFNGAGQLLQLNSSAQVADNLLTGNVALLDRSSQTFTGNNTFQNATDSASAFQIQNATGTSNLLIADTQYTRLGIGLASPSYTLDVNGDVNIAAANSLRIGGTQICDITGCSASGGSGNYIQNDTALQGSANFNIQSASDVPTTVVRAHAIQTSANLSEWQDVNGAPMVTISPSGAVAAASFAGNGAGLTALNAANITAGDLNDARLSNNVPLLGSDQIFTGTSNTFTGTIYTNAITPTATMMIGATDQQLTLQGNGSTQVVATSYTGLNTNTTTIGFGATATTNRSINYVFLRNVASGTYNVCTTSGNCIGGSGGGANTTLSNLLHPTAINQDLLPGVAGAIDLGTNAKPFGTISFAGTANTPDSQNFTLTGNPGGQRIITFPDANGTVCLNTGNCTSGGGGGANGYANAALSNLSDVAINTSLLPGTNNSIDLGSSAYKFKDLWLGGVIQGGVNGGNSTAINFNAPSGNNTIFVPDASGTVAVSAVGNIALSASGQISFTGTLPVGSGGTGATTLLQNGVLYGNGTGAIGATAAGTTGQCLIGQTGAAPIFGNCASSGSGVTLQAAYDNGNTIATTDARNLTVTLANTTTDANFLVNIASSSTGKFAVQNNGTDMLKVDTTGGVLANTDVTLAKRSDSAAGNYTQYQATVSTGYPSITNGSFTGDGTASQVINLPANWGEPAVLIVFPKSSIDSNVAAIKTGNMASNESRQFSNMSSMSTTHITDLDANTFTVGTSLNVNNQDYSYMAIRANGGGSVDNYFSYGTYSGNGQNNRVICTNGEAEPGCIVDTIDWSPDYVMVVKRTNPDGWSPIWRNSTMSGDNSFRGFVDVPASNLIKSLNQNNFIIGNDNHINQNGSDYYWFALNEMPGHFKVGSYVGNDTAQQITGLGFVPNYIALKADYNAYCGGNPDCWRGVIKGAGMGSNTFAPFGGDIIGNGITSFDADGFTVGNSNYVNDGTPGSLNYYYAAMADYTDTSQVNGYSAGAVYNGKFYTATKLADSAELYRFDGGISFTKISSPGAGKINGLEDDTVVDSIPAMKVFDGKLFIGTDTGADGKASVYYCSNISGNCNSSVDWTQVNTTAGTLDGGTTGIDGIKSMAVVGGVLYVATSESEKSEIYRYNGSTGAAVFTKISDSTAGKIISGDTANIDSVNLVNYQGMLYAGTQTGSDGTAGLYAYSGDSSWSLVNPTRGTFASTANIDDVTAMAVYNGSLVLGTGDSTANLGEIYRYNAPQGGATSGSNLFSKISDATAGRIDSTGSARVDTIGAMTVYNGVLLVSSNNTTGDGAIYKFNGVNSWSKLGTESEGTFGGTSSVSGIQFMTQYNDSLFSGSNKSGGAFIYTIAENSSMSYALKFTGSSDGAFDNIGSIAFMSADQAGANFNNHGQFLLSHTLTTSAGAYDIAEDYLTSDDELKAGDVAAIDPGREAGYVRRADLAKGDGLRLLGVVSTHPAFRLSQKENFNPAAGSRTIPVALAGRVPVRIDPESEAVVAGDYLAASPKAGMARKSTQTGAVIGKALESWQKGSGKTTVEIFVSNTFLLPNGEPINSSVRDQVEHGLRDVSLWDAFLATGEDGLRLLKDSTFIGKVFFKDDVYFDGRLRFGDRDMAGRIKFKAGQKQIEVKFEKPFEKTPIISLTPQQFSVYKIKEKSEKGFIVELEQSASTELEFDWIALDAKDPKTIEKDDINLDNESN